MKKIIFKYICLVVMALFVFSTAVKAQTELGTHVTLTYSEGSFNITNTNFNSSAKSIKVFFDFGEEALSWGTVAYDRWNSYNSDKNLLTLSASKRYYTIIVTQSDIISEIASNSGISVSYADARSIKVIVTNYDTEDGAANDNSEASGIEPNAGSGSGTGTGTGSGTGTTTPPSNKTLAQKIADRDQITNVPTIYITVPDAEGQTINSVLDEKKEYHTATIQIVDKTEGGLTEFTDNVMIKVRGNSTARENKKPYRLKFAKEITDADGNVIANCQKHDMLGKGYSKRNWALLANYLDPAMVRNALTYKIGELVCMPFKPGYKFADVVINDEYRGTYQITDHVEADADRVNVNEDTGWFLESARGDMVEEPSASAQSLMMSIKNPEPKTDAEIATLKTQIENWFKPVDELFCIYNGTFDLDTFKDPVNGWRKYWDEETLVGFYIGINITGDYDGFMTVKMYRDLDKKLKFGPLWDKDLAFGNYKEDNGLKLSEDQQIGSYFSSYVKRLWLDPVFVKKVHDKLDALIANGLVTTLKDNVDELAELTAQTEELNRPLWGIGASWSQSFSTREATINQLKGYLDQHIPWFQNAIKEQYIKLGGDGIVDNSIPGDDFNDGTTPGDGGGSGSVEIPETSTFEKLNVTDTGYKIPASAFNSNATSIEVTFTRSNGTATNVWGFYGYNGSEWNAKGISGSNWNTYTINITNAEDIAAVAQNGIAWRLQNDGGSTGDVTIVVHNIGVPEGGNGTDTPEPPAVRAQLTNLPTIYLDATVGNDWSAATIQVYDSENKLAQGAEWTSSALEVQYQGSGDKNKDSYRLKFGAKTQLLSSGSFKQWVLLANDDDPTMMRNALAKEMGDALGLPFTPGYQFVDLYVNDQYMGTYQVTDRIKVEKGRALVSGGNKDIDWHVRFNDAGEYNEDKPAYFIAGTASMPYIIPKNPDPKDDLTAWNSTLKSDMTAYFNNVFSMDAEGEYTAFADNVDKQQLIQWYIAQEMLCVYKGFSSVEAYRSATAADKNLHIGVIWDSEKAFGNTGEAPAISMADLNTAGSYDGLMTNYAAYDVMKTVFSQLWQQPWFAIGVNSLWEETHDAMLSALNAKIAALQSELSESWARNAAKWSISGEQAMSITTMTEWLTQRDAYLTKKFAALAAALPCDHHTFAKNNYIEQTNGTYLLGCDNCGAIKEDSETYYKFTVYPESADATEVIATSWHPSDEHPNSIAVVEAKRNIVEKIEGWNIVCGKKTTFADGSTGLTCKDFRLTDGHPYYSDNKFVATTATYTRALGEKEQYGMMTLPFKHQNAENEDAAFYHIAAVEGGKIQLVAIDPSVEGNASAYLPVIFKCKAGKTSVTVTGTDITVKKTSADKFNSTCEGWTIIGAVENTSVDADGNNLYEMSDAQAGKVASANSVSVAPFRAYISTTVDAPQTPLTFTLSNELSIATLVEAINQLKSGSLTVKDIEDMVDELLNRE